MKKHLLFLLALCSCLITTAATTVVIEASGQSSGGNGAPVFLGQITTKPNVYYRLEFSTNPGGATNWLCFGNLQSGSTAYFATESPSVKRFDTSTTYDIWTSVTWSWNSQATVYTGTAKITEMSCPDIDIDGDGNTECQLLKCTKCGELYCYSHRDINPHACQCPFSVECTDTKECECRFCTQMVCYTHDNYPCNCEFSECTTCKWLLSEGKITLPEGEDIPILCHEHDAAIKARQCPACGVYYWCASHGTADHTCPKTNCPYRDDCSKPLHKCDECGNTYCGKHAKHLKDCTGCGELNVCPTKHECQKCPNIKNVCDPQTCSQCGNKFCKAHQAGEHVHKDISNNSTEAPCPKGANCVPKTCTNCQKSFCSTHQSHTCSANKGGGGGIGGIGSVTTELSCPNTPSCNVISCDKCSQLYCSTHVTHDCSGVSGVIPVCPNQDDCQLVVCPECDVTYCETHTPHATHYCPHLKACVKVACEKCEQVYCETHDVHSCPDCPFTVHCLRMVCANCGDIYCTASHAAPHVCGSNNSGTSGSGTSGSGTSGSGTSGSGTSGSGGGISSVGSSGSSTSGSTYFLSIGGSDNSTAATATETKQDNSSVGLAVGAAGVAFGMGNAGTNGRIFGQYDCVTQERLDALRENPRIRNWPLYDAQKAAANAGSNSKYYTKGGVNYVRE